MAEVRLLLPAVLLAALLGRSAIADCPPAEAAAWPGTTWPTGAAARPAAVGAFDALAFPPGQDEAGRAGPRTNGLVVVKDGRLVYERYARGFGPGTPHIVWSATKSVLHAVYGAAAAEGLVDIDRPVAEGSPWIGGGAKARITYRELLQMRSGLAWNEGYEYTPLRSSVLAMLYTRGRADMARFAAGQPLAAEPGTTWAYKSGDSLILSAALRDLVGAERYPDYPWTALFDRIGITSAVWERDATGTFVGSSYLYATPRDMARLGLLYLRDGCWAGTRILPEGWVALAGTPSPALEGPGIYGAHWWLNRPGPDGAQAFADAPEDMLVASGHWGQKLIVLPAHGLVIARAADDCTGFDTGPFIQAAVAAFAP
jgi:CubicO group peptidase (beta-lactamase class C family)